jgi:hypothetical protein
MENTYNYFFSATPQVLAAIFGLFGVFIVFRISEIHHLINLEKDRFFKEIDGYHNAFYQEDNKWGKKIYNLYGLRDIYGLYNELDKIIECCKKNNFAIQNYFTFIKQRLDLLISFKKELIENAKYASIVTLATIAYCLLLLMIGFALNHCVCLAFFSFVPAFSSSIYIFITLISIIKYSFSD